MTDPSWGWCSWALATYGCRPAEVFSLRPADDGTAQVLTIKRKGKLPTWRTDLALPVAGDAPGERSVPCVTAREYIQTRCRWQGAGRRVLVPSSMICAMPGAFAASASCPQLRSSQSAWVTTLLSITAPTTAGWIKPILQGSQSA